MTRFRITPAPARGFRQTFVLPPAAPRAPAVAAEPIVETPQIGLAVGYSDSSPGSGGGEYTLVPLDLASADTFDTGNTTGVIDRTATALATVVGTVSTPTWRVVFAPSGGGGSNRATVQSWGGCALLLKFDPDDGSFQFGEYSIYATVNGVEIGPVVYTFTGS